MTSPQARTRGAKRKADENIRDVDKRVKQCDVTKGRSISLYCEALTIHVSDDTASEPVPFDIHPGKLRLSAPYVLQACTNFKDTENGRHCSLKGVSAPVFSMFVAWIYTRELVPPQPHMFERSEEEEAELKENARRLVSPISNTQAHPRLWVDDDLVKVWIFACEHNIEPLMDLAISELWLQNENSQSTTSLTAVCLAFELEWADSDICTFLASEAVRRLHLRRTNIPQDTKDWPSDYIAQILRSVLDQDCCMKSNSPQDSLCRGHMHDADKNSSCLTLWKARKLDRTFDSTIYSMLDSIITLYVDGPRPMKFVVHKGLATKCSEFLRGAFNGHFTESQAGELLLSDEQVGPCHLFISWIYSRTVRRGDWDEIKGLDGLEATTRRVQQAQELNASDRPVGASDDYGPRRVFLDDLLQLYILADRRGVQELQNQLMDDFICQLENNWLLLTASAERVCCIYDFLPETSGLRLYAIHEALCYWDWANMAADMSAYPSEFLGVVVKGLLARNTSAQEDPIWRDNICVYHHHQNERERQECFEQSQKFQIGLGNKKARQGAVKTVRRSA